MTGDDGDDDLFGGEGDDFLDGGAEASQDTGDGGETGEVEGDFCTEIEAPVNCESEGFAALRSSRSSWAGASGATPDTWARFRL